MQTFRQVPDPERSVPVPHSQKLVPDDPHVSHFKISKALALLDGGLVKILVKKEDTFICTDSERMIKLYSQTVFKLSYLQVSSKCPYQCSTQKG